MVTGQSYCNVNLNSSPRQAITETEKQFHFAHLNWNLDKYSHSCSQYRMEMKVTALQHYQSYSMNYHLECLDILVYTTAFNFHIIKMCL